MLTIRDDERWEQFDISGTNIGTAIHVPFFRADGDSESKARMRADKAAEKTQVAASSAFIQSLRVIAELNINSAIERMGGLEDLYESIFMITHRKLADNIAKLDAFLEKDSLEGFAIEVRGLKGALNHIGCSSLADLAAGLERASKDGDGDYCRRHYDEFKGRVLQLYKNAAAVIPEVQRSVREKGDGTLLSHRLADAKTACEEQDSFAACIILTELSDFDYSVEINSLLDSALLAAENCDYMHTLEYIARAEKLILPEL